MKMIIEQLREKLVEFENDNATSELDLSNRVILWLLEECLGYNRDCMRWEYTLPSKVKKGYTDILISVNEKEKLVVETKNYNNKLDKDDLGQLLDYLIKVECVWGILTNGREIWLINRLLSESINVNDIVVLKIDIAVGKHKGKNEKYIGYLSKQMLFDSKVTNYFRDIAYFFSIHELSNDSKGKYTNTLYNFFDYYAKSGNEYLEYGYNKHQSLEEVSEREVIKFLKEERPFGRPYQGGVPKAKCAHIGTMFRVLYEKGYINRNNLENLLSRATIEFSSSDNARDVSQYVLTLSDMQYVLSALEEQNKPSKIIIFVLCGYYGFDRSLIVDFFSLPWACIDYEHKKFELNGKKYPLVSLLAENLKKKQQEYKEKGIKAKAINVVKKGKGYVPVKKDVVNSLFSEDIQLLGRENERLGNLTAQNMRAMVIYGMCKSGCAVDEVCYLTNATPSQVLRYVPEEIIQQNGSRSWSKGSRAKGSAKHPYKEIFDI